jgi:hypothetical protein
MPLDDNVDTTMWDRTRVCWAICGNCKQQRWGYYPPHLNARSHAVPYWECTPCLVYQLTMREMGVGPFLKWEVGSVREHLLLKIARNIGLPETRNGMDQTLAIIREAAP